MRIAVPSMLGDGPTVLPRQVSHQPEHEPTYPAAGLDPREPGSQPIKQPVGLGAPPPNIYAVARGHRLIFRSRHNGRGSRGGRPASGTATPQDHDQYGQLAPSVLVLPVILGSSLNGWGRLPQVLGTHYWMDLYGRSQPEKQGSASAGICEASSMLTTMYPPRQPSMSVKYAASGFNSSIIDWIVDPSVPAFAS
jgi:hypothetical protein